MSATPGLVIIADTVRKQVLNPGQSSRIPISA